MLFLHPCSRSCHPLSENPNKNRHINLVEKRERKRERERHTHIKNKNKEERGKEEKRKSNHTWTTSSRPLASFLSFLFFVSRKLATRKIASSLL